MKHMKGEKDKGEQESRAFKEERRTEVQTRVRLNKWKDDGTHTMGTGDVTRSAEILWSSLAFTW